MANTVAELEALLRGATLGTQRDTITTYSPIWVGGLECSGGSRLYVPIKRFQWRSLGRRGIFVQTDGGANRYVGEFNPETLRAHGYGAEELYGNTYSGQWADGLRHGHVVARWANGTIEYGLYDRNTESRSAVEHKHGAFEFGGEPCAAGDARFAELKRAALESEVRLRPAGLFTPHSELPTLFFFDHGTGAGEAGHRRDRGAPPPHPRCRPCTSAHARTHGA
jgi:hypothetical protein